jgi:ribonuclease-3
MALAVLGALEPAVYDRAMRRGATPNPTTDLPKAAKQDNNRAATAAAAPTAKKPVENPPAKKPAAKTAAPVKRPNRKRAAAASALETTIGYKFKDRDMLGRALTHISASGGNRGNSYQRLEFLGDHVLGLIISDMLYRAFPKGDEGELSRRLADLVRREACADVARAINIGEALRLGSSENNAGGRTRTAILADVCEALVGAVFVDGGYEAAVKLVDKLWGERMRTPVRPLRDPKTILQEWAQARGLPAPTYREVARTGPEHSPVFRVAVMLPGKESVEGVDRSKRGAEQAAAAALLAREGVKAARADG